MGATPPGPKDCYRILEAGKKFKLDEGKRQYCGDGKVAGVAVAVSSHGARDTVAILLKNGIYSVYRELIRRENYALPERPEELSRRGTN